MHLSDHITARSLSALHITFYQHVYSFTLCHIWMKPAKYSIWINIFIEVIYKVTEDHPLLSSAMSRHPEPTITHIIVHKENITFLETSEKHVILVTLKELSHGICLQVRESM